MIFICLSCQRRYHSYSWELTLTNSQREEVKLNSCTWPQFHSFLPLFLNKCVLPFPPGNITVIPWTVSAQRGNTISQRENRIIVQEDGYYLVFGQVLCHSKWSVTKLILHMIYSKYSANVLLNSQVLFQSQSTVMGHVIQSWSSTEGETRPTELLRCLQDITEGAYDNTCYTAGQWDQTAAAFCYMWADKFKGSLRVAIFYSRPIFAGHSALQRLRYKSKIICIKDTNFIVIQRTEENKWVVSRNLCGQQSELL